MVAIAVIGAVAALAGSLLAWRLIGQLGGGTDRSLRLAGDALATLDDTIDVAEDVVASVQDSLTTVEAGLRTLQQSTEDTVAVAGIIAQATEDVPASLTRVEEGLGGLAAIAATADSALRELSALPVGPDYDPDVTLDATIADVRDDLGPIIEGFTEAQGPLEDLSGDGEILQGDLTALANQVADVDVALAESRTLLARYRQTAADAADLASETRAELSDDIRWSRFLVVALGLIFALGQIVPLWFGLELRNREPPSAASGLGAPPPTGTPGG